MNQLFPLHKSEPPFMEAKGFHGYLGVILYDPITKLIQCHLCGKMVQGIGYHIRTSHRTEMKNTEEYKDKFSLNRGTSLTSPELGRRLSKRSQNTYVKNGLQKKFLGQGGKRHGKRKSTLQRFNAIGTCPLQLENRFHELVKKKEKTPTKDELPKDMWAAIRYRYETYSNFLSTFGFHSEKKPLSIIKKSDVITAIQSFYYYYGHEPYSNDVIQKRLYPIQTFAGIYKFFKSFTDAKKEALKDLPSV